MKPASIDSDWSLGQESLDVVVELFRGAVPRTIVEFGSGASSVGLAKAFPGAQVLSVEHDPAWAWRTKALARSAGVENLCISLRPLKWQLHHFSLYQSYAPGALPATIDAALIDGPPYWAHVGREACFYQIARRLRRGSVLVLDDYSRGAEQNAVANWMLKYPRCLAAKSERVGHHLCVVDVTAPPVPVLNPLSLVRSWRALAARVRLEMWRTSKKRGW